MGDTGKTHEPRLTGVNGAPAFCSVALTIARVSFDHFHSARRKDTIERPMNYRSGRSDNGALGVFGILGRSIFFDAAYRIEEKGGFARPFLLRHFLEIE